MVLPSRETECLSHEERMNYVFISEFFQSDSYWNISFHRYAEVKGSISVFRDT